MQASLLAFEILRADPYITYPCSLLSTGWSQGRPTLHAGKKDDGIHGFELPNLHAARRKFPIIQEKRKQEEKTQNKLLDSVLSFFGENPRVYCAGCRRTRGFNFNFPFYYFSSAGESQIVGTTFNSSHTTLSLIPSSLPFTSISSFLNLNCSGHRTDDNCRDDR